MVARRPAQRLRWCRRLRDARDCAAYLEKVAEAAFKREFEQDENIVRSLPFFATALGLAVAIFTQIAPRVTTLSYTAGLIVGLFLGLAGVAFVVILWCLFQIVRAREFKIPPNEESFVKWARETEEFYRARRRSAIKAAELAQADARRVMIQAYAEAAVDNRKSNRHKFAYRAQGFTFLVILIALASLSVGVIFIDKQWPRLAGQGAPNGEELSVAENRTERLVGTVPAGEEAAAATNQDRDSRLEVSGSSGREGLNDVRRESSTPASTAASASANGTRQKEQ